MDPKQIGLFSRQKIWKKPVSVREKLCLCGHHWLIANSNNSNPISWLMPVINVLSDLIRISFESKLCLNV